MYPVFLNHQYSKIIINSLYYCRINKGLNLHAYVIMSNHLHLIISANEPGTISSIFRDFKRYTSSKISELLKKENRKTALDIFKEAAIESRNNQQHKIWQRGFHPIALHSAAFFAQKFDYLHQNPVRKGYVQRPEHWLYSSARNYAGSKDIPLNIDKLDYTWLH